MYEIGFSKQDITFYKENIGMYGYGMHFHVMRDVKTRLYSRCFIIQDTATENKIAFVNVELMSVSTAVRNKVIKILKVQHPESGLSMHNVMLTATHTHSAPGGFSHYPYYNLTVPGFVKEVFETIVNGIVTSIIHANEQLVPAKIKFGVERFEDEKPVAFNRTLKAYNNNPEVEKVSRKDSHLALDRNMYLLRFEDLSGNPIGCLNWFGVHPTNIGNDKYSICGDNKGYASSYFEELLPGKVAIFAQGTCGDISPNYIWNRKRQKMRGKYEDDYESAQYNGQLQVEKASEIFKKDDLTEIKGHIDSGLKYGDFSNMKIDPKFANGIEGQKTGKASLGVSFFAGTTDGKGTIGLVLFIMKLFVWVIEIWDRLRFPLTGKRGQTYIINKYTWQKPKLVATETGDGRLFGIERVDLIPLPYFLDKTLATFRNQYKSGALDTKPWTPHVLPAQIFIIGPLAIVGVSAEITTVAGQRLKASVLDELKNKGVNEVIISPYANAYSGYITTYEEYLTQCYEGGHTLYGKWTLGAHQTLFKKLCVELLKPDEERILDEGLRPVRFSDEEILKRSYGITY